MTTWKRSTNIPYPSVWSSFEAKDSDSDKLVEYRVQDLPEDRFEDAIQHMVDEFLMDENTCRLSEFHKYPKAVEEIATSWREILEQKLVIVCFREGSDEIVGLNFCHAKTLQDANGKLPKHFPYTTIADPFYFVFNKVNIFEKYNVDKYLSAFGLSVGRKYRGCGIAANILKARIPLAKAVGFELSTTAFSNSRAQAAARKAGFEVDYEITYDELEKKHGFVFPGNEMKFYNLMSLRIK